LKLIFEVAPENLDVVETLRKPSTGLKHITVTPLPLDGGVETLRKPSTGLKQMAFFTNVRGPDGRDTQKTQHGIETGWETVMPVWVL